MESLSKSQPPPFRILIVFFALGLIGLVLIPRLTVQLLPDRNTASLSVSCSMANSSSQMTERLLTNPIERSLSTVQGIQGISSTTYGGNSNVVIELDTSTDPELFRLTVSTILRRLYTDLPSSASYPLVTLNRQTNQNNREEDLLGYTLNGPGTVNEISQFAEQYLKPMLSSIEGIDQVSIYGTQSQQISIQVLENKIQHTGLTTAAIGRVVAAKLSSYSLGTVQIDKERCNINIDKSVTDIDDIRNLKLYTTSGRMLILKDIAKVEIEKFPLRGYYRINGQDLIQIGISAKKNVNTIRLAKEVRQRLSTIEQDLHHLGYTLQLSFDNTQQIKTELNKVYVRTVLSVCILLLFVMLITGSLRYLLIVILSLLANLLLSVIFYYLFDLSIHLYSLAGITISMGLIIDNVIIIIDDSRHTGTNRIFSAILASTFTALGSLSVVFLLQDHQVLNLSDFGQAVMINLFVSIPVAYYFVPALLNKVPVRNHHEKVKWRRAVHTIRRQYSYAGHIRFFMRFKKALLILFILMFGLPFFMLPEKAEHENIWSKLYNMTFGSDFYNYNLRNHVNSYLGGLLYLYIGNPPRSDQELEKKTQLYVNITMPYGATLDQMDKVVKDFEVLLNNFSEEIVFYSTSVNSPVEAMIRIEIAERYDQRFPNYLKRLLEQSAIYAGAADFTIYGVGRGFSNVIDIDNFDSSLEIKGYNYDQLQSLAMQVRDSLMTIPRVQNITISSSPRREVKRYDEFFLRIADPSYLALYQIEQQRLSTMLQVYQMQQQAAGRATLDAAGSEVPVTVKRYDQQAVPVWDVMHMPLQYNDTTMIRIRNVAKMDKVRSDNTIVRSNKAYLLNVHYHFVGTYELKQIIEKRIIQNLSSVLPQGYQIITPGYAGGNDLAKQKMYLGYVLLGIFIIYLICAVLLESWRQPLVVIVMIPFSYMGVFLICYLLNLSFDQGGYAALIMLSGLVSNAALYIVNDYNYVIKRCPVVITPYLKNRIFIKVFFRKIMPVLITTASAILSLIPFMISGDEQGFWFTLSAGTIGGLLFSLIGAYVLLPLCMLFPYQVMYKNDQISRP